MQCVWGGRVGGEYMCGVGTMAVEQIVHERRPHDYVGLHIHPQVRSMMHGSFL